MKTFRALLLIFACALFFSYNATGQVIKKTIVVTLDQLNYDPVCPGLGTVSGYYVYELNMKMSKEGFLERLTFHVGKSDLKNENGDKVIIVDSGTDNLGILWDWFNNANYYNHVLWECPEIVYDTDDGWLDEYLAPVWPSEGVTVEMSCKVLCKGVIFNIPVLAVVQINANGEMVVNFFKP